MSSQSAASRRAAALAAAAQIGPMSSEITEAIKQRLEQFAKKRAERNPPDRREAGDRRSGSFDRRGGPSATDRRENERRQFATMADKLAAESAKHDDDRRFTGAALSQFGEPQ